MKTVKLEAKRVLPLGGKEFDLKKKRVAAYARVSTLFDDQQESLKAQIDYYEKKIRANPEWEYAGVYSDEGRSGTSYKHRENFKRMIQDAKEGKIDMILTKSISRFARNTVDSLSCIRELKECDVGVFFERENIWTLDPKGELLITLLTSIAQEEARSISENTTWGIRKRIKDGKYAVPYSAFMGYDCGGKNTLVINEEQAQIVRLIFRMYLQGYGFCGIVKNLEKLGIKTMHNKDRFHNSVIRDMCQNEKYKGDALLQKKYTIDFLTHKRMKNTGQVDQVYVTDGHEAIIERAVFDYLQEQIERNLVLHRNCGRNNRIDVGIFVCGDCGSLFRSYVEHRYEKYRRDFVICRNRYYKTKCKKQIIEKEKINDILRQLVERVMEKNPDILLVCNILLMDMGLCVNITENYNWDMHDLRMVLKHIKVYSDRLEAVFVDGSSEILDMPTLRRRYRRNEK